MRKRPYRTEAWQVRRRGTARIPDSRTPNFRMQDCQRACVRPPAAGIPGASERRIPVPWCGQFFLTRRQSGFWPKAARKDVRRLQRQPAHTAKRGGPGQLASRTTRDWRAAKPPCQGGRRDRRADGRGVVRVARRGGLWRAGGRQAGGAKKETPPSWAAECGPPLTAGGGGARSAYTSSASRARASFC